MFVTRYFIIYSFYQMLLGRYSQAEWDGLGMQQAWGRRNIDTNKQNLVGTYRVGEVSGRPSRRPEEHTKTNLKEGGCWVNLSDLRQSPVV